MNQKMARKTALLIVKVQGGDFIFIVEKETVLLSKDLLLKMVMLNMVEEFAAITHLHQL